MRSSCLAAAAAVASLAAAALAQPAAPPTFSPEAFRAHVEFLADDRLEGRDAGSRGYDIAADYVAQRFAALGLKPAVNGGWYQPVPFVEYRLADAPPRVTVGRRSFAQAKEVVIWPDAARGPQTIEAPVVFVGYGLDMPGRGFDDYAGLDVRGKIVAMLSGTPAGLPSDLAAHIGSEKTRMAERNGAIGTIGIRTRAAARQLPWTRLAGQAGRPELTWTDPDGRPYSAAPGIRVAATFDTAAAEALFAGARRPLKQILDEVEKGVRPKGFALAQPVRIERQSVSRTFSSPNVIGLLPGSDPALAGEYVLLMAHLDHIGVAPIADGTGDRINNGAMDNATGVATMIEAARAFVTSGTRPRRPILFAAVTAEEDGLLGAQYLAKHPVTGGGGKVVAVVNLDMPVLLYDFTEVIAFGAEHSTLGRVVARAGAGMGVRPAQDPLPDEGLFTRSDHYRFVQEGVPAVFLMTGFANGGEKKFTQFLTTHYHRPSDEVGPGFDWQAGAKFARLNYLIAREIADAPRAPLWYAGSFFGEVFAPGQAKAAK
ncbi:MAG TPA: M28 family metallopeptidase [Allosphingosinicella sp.]|nr:M28 family metallopeptidase [Allosphingosinicella sp.]